MSTEAKTIEWTEEQKAAMVPDFTTEEYEKAFAHVLTCAEKCFKDDEHCDAVIFFVDPFGNSSAIPALMGNDAEKEFTGMIMRSMARNGAKCVAMVSETWSLAPPKGASEEELKAFEKDVKENWLGRFEEHPNRCENVMVNFQGKGFTAMASATIDRSGEKPVLTPWERHDITKTEGRFCNLFDEESQDEGEPVDAATAVA